MADGLNLKSMPPAVWAIVIGGGLAVGYFINRKNSSAPTVQQPVETGVGAGGTGGFADVNPPTSTPSSSGDATNDAWRIRVSNAMISQGSDPLTTDAALRKYLAGQSLNVVEQAIVSRAITLYGLPPQPISGPGNQGPTAVTGLTMVPTGPRRVTVSWVPSPGATAYTVIMSNQLGQETFDGVLAPPLIDDHLWPDMDHQATVIAKNDTGQSEPRTTTAHTPPETGSSAPSAPPPNPGPAPAPAPAPQPGPETWVVDPGDSLWGISLKHYGTPGRWMDIYNANVGVIEDTARRHGKSSANGPNGSKGWWIFPGEVLVLP